MGLHTHFLSCAASHRQSWSSQTHRACQQGREPSLPACNTSGLFSCKSQKVRWCVRTTVGCGVSESRLWWIRYLPLVRYLFSVHPSSVGRSQDFFLIGQLGRWWEWEALRCCLATGLLRSKLGRVPLSVLRFYRNFQVYFLIIPVLLISLVWFYYNWVFTGVPWWSIWYK